MPRALKRENWTDDEGVVGYAEGEMDGREFTVSWAAGRRLGASFYDTWVEAPASTTRLCARALTDAGAVPLPQVVPEMASSTRHDFGV